MISTMPRRFQRRRAMLAPIVSYKHQKSTPLSYLGGGANNFDLLYLGGAPGADASVDVVPSGNKVYSVDVSVNYISGSGSISSTFSWMIVHLRDDQSVGTMFAQSDASNWSVIGLVKGRNQVIKSYMGIVGTEDAGSSRANIHIKIPKQWHRVREGDQLYIVFNAQEAGTLNTGFRYKSYS